jgi:hypothetical protein
LPDTTPASYGSPTPAAPAAQAQQAILSSLNVLVSAALSVAKQVHPGSHCNEVSIRELASELLRISGPATWPPPAPTPSLTAPAPLPAPAAASLGTPAAIPVHAKRPPDPSAARAGHAKPTSHPPRQTRRSRDRVLLTFDHPPFLEERLSPLELRKLANSALEASECQHRVSAVEYTRNGHVAVVPLPPCTGKMLLEHEIELVQALRHGYAPRNVSASLDNAWHGLVVSGVIPPGWDGNDGSDEELFEPQPAREAQANLAHAALDDIFDFNPRLRDSDRSLCTSYRLLCSAEDQPVAGHSMSLCIFMASADLSSRMRRGELFLFGQRARVSVYRPRKQKPPRPTT